MFPSLHVALSAIVYDRDVVLSLSRSQDGLETYSHNVFVSSWSPETVGGVSLGLALLQNLDISVSCPKVSFSTYCSS